MKNTSTFFGLMVNCVKPSYVLKSQLLTLPFLESRVENGEGTAFRIRKLTLSLRVWS